MISHFINLPEALYLYYISSYYDTRSNSTFVGMNRVDLISGSIGQISTSNVANPRTEIRRFVDGKLYAAGYSTDNKLVVINNPDGAYTTLNIQALGATSSYTLQPYLPLHSPIILAAFWFTDLHPRRLGRKIYEINDHLGNVRTVVSDRKESTIDGSGRPTSFMPDLVAGYNYYPFGSLQPNRFYNVQDYRYGFNGMEKDDEVRGAGNHVDFGARGYDSMLGRFLSKDPMHSAYPSLSAYSFVGLNPITNVEVDGNYWVYFGRNPKGHYTIRIVDPEIAKGLDNYSYVPFLGASAVVTKGALAIQDPSLDLSAGDWWSLMSMGLGWQRGILKGIGKLTKTERLILKASPLLADLTLAIIENPEYADLFIEKQVLKNIGLVDGDISWTDYNDEGMVEGITFTPKFSASLEKTAMQELGFTMDDMKDEEKANQVHESVISKISEMMDIEKKKIKSQVEENIEKIKSSRTD